MTFLQFMMAMLTATLLLWTGFFWTVFAIDPFQTSWIGHVLFYLTLFLSLLGTFSLGGIWLRKKWVHEQALYRLVTLAIRQSVSLSMFFVLVLFLQGQNILRWWIILSLFLAVFGLEFFQLLKERKYASVHTQKPVEHTRTEMAYEPIFERKKISPLVSQGETLFDVTKSSD